MNLLFSKGEREDVNCCAPMTQKFPLGYNLRFKESSKDGTSAFELSLTACEHVVLILLS